MHARGSDAAISVSSLRQGLCYWKCERNPSDNPVAINRYGLILVSLYPSSACKEQDHSCLQKKRRQIFPVTGLIYFTKYGSSSSEKDTE